MSIFYLDEGRKQFEAIQSQIAEKSPTGEDQRVFLQSVITEFDASESTKYMATAQNYYENKNDILKNTRKIIGKDENNNPCLKEAQLLSNNKLCHNFMKKLTRQKIGYMLGRAFSLASVKPEDTEAEKFFEALQKYFTKEFFKMIKNIGRDSIVKGIGWLMVYYDEQGQLKFRRCAPEEIVPFWSDCDHTYLDAVVRKYSVEEYKNGKKRLIKYVEYYTLEGVYYYVYDDSGKLIPEEDKGTQPSPHFSVKTGDETYLGTNWLKIPFIPFKYDPDEQSLLIRIKSLVDDYDKKTSDLANDIDDHPNSVTVIKNYDGASKEEFVQNKNELRTIFTQGDGDAKALETPLDIEQTDIHIQRLREDIYEFGQGVNTADKDIRDTSGVALRFMYADLDMDCIDWGSEVEWSLMQLIWFIQQDMKARDGVDYTAVQYDIIFNTDVIINETETINNCAISAGIISGQTIAENHPWTKKAKTEMERMRNEQEESLDLESEYGEKVNTALSGQRTSVGQGAGLK